MEPATKATLHNHCSPQTYTPPPLLCPSCCTPPLEATLRHDARKRRSASRTTCTRYSTSCSPRPTSEEAALSSYMRGRRLVTRGATMVQARRWCWATRGGGGGAQGEQRWSEQGGGAWLHGKAETGHEFFLF